MGLRSLVNVRSSTVLANGLRFALDEAGEGDRVMLFLHGFPQARHIWRAQLEYFGARGWRAVAPDLRGYGATDRPAGVNAYELRHLIDDIEGLFVALGARDRFLVGHDWGGIVAWQAALRQDRRLDGLVILNAPHPEVFKSVLARSATQRRKSRYVAMFRLPWLPEFLLTARQAHALVRIMRLNTGPFPPELMAICRNNILQTGAATAMLNYYRANAEVLMTGRPAGGQVKIPTLMIWGAEDAALDLELAEGNEEYVANLSVQRLPGVSHWVMTEAPGSVNALIDEWTLPHLA